MIIGNLKLKNRRVMGYNSKAAMQGVCRKLPHLKLVLSLLLKYSESVMQTVTVAFIKQNSVFSPNKLDSMRTMEHGRKNMNRYVCILVASLGKDSGYVNFSSW